MCVILTRTHGRRQVSFVNSIATTRGGSHVNHVSDQLAQLYLDYLAKKHKGLKLKPFQVPRQALASFSLPPSYAGMRI